MKRHEPEGESIRSERFIGSPDEVVFGPEIDAARSKSVSTENGFVRVSGMSLNRSIVKCGEGAPEVWVPTTFAALGKSEEELEAVLANSPELLRLESRKTGIGRPFCIFRQLGMDSPQGRSVYPDIVLLAASGNIVIVEVKLGGNQELRDRRVLSQIVDYAATFSAMSEQQVVRLFGKPHPEAKNWPELVHALFPDDHDFEELALVFLARFKSGELNMIVACDRVPPGVGELLAGVASQAGLGFDLDLVEVVPYVRDGGDNREIMFVPTTKLATQIVARTAVTVTFQPGTPQPEVTVNTTSLEELEESIRTGGRVTRNWDEASFFGDAERKLDPAGALGLRRLFDFLQTSGAKITWGKGTVTGSFGVAWPQLCAKNIASFYSSGSMYVQFGTLRDGPNLVQFKERFKASLEDRIGLDLPDDYQSRWLYYRAEEWLHKSDELIAILRDLWGEFS